MPCSPPPARARAVLRIDMKSMTSDQELEEEGPLRMTVSRQRGASDYRIAWKRMETRIFLRQETSLLGKRQGLLSIYYPGCSRIKSNLAGRVGSGRGGAGRGGSSKGDPTRSVGVIKPLDPTRPVRF